MRKVLYMLGQLADSDIEWLAGAGRTRRLEAGTTLIRAGMPPAALYVVLEGELQVVDDRAGLLAELASGEIVGEMSFVDRTPPQASVIAGVEARVLEISRRALDARIEADAAFGMRFYRALSIFLADRLRGTVRRLGYGEAGDTQAAALLEDELDESVLDGVSLAGERFGRLLRTLSGAQSA